MFWIVFLTLTLILIAGFMVGRNRALALAGGDPAKLHSLPGYYGWYAALLVAGPGFLLFFLWSIIAPRIEQQMIFDRLGERVANLGVPQLQGLWRDIRIIAAGVGTPSLRDDLRNDGATIYRTVNDWSDALMVALIALLVAAGVAYALRTIAPRLRARHVIERALLVFLFLSASVAVLTTFGIVFSLIFESLRFFQMVSPFEFLFGLTWTPQQMAFRADQAGGVAAFGFIP